MKVILLAGDGDGVIFGNALDLVCLLAGMVLTGKSDMSGNLWCERRLAVTSNCFFSYGSFSMQLRSYSSATSEGNMAALCLIFHVNCESIEIRVTGPFQTVSNTLVIVA